MAGCTRVAPIPSPVKKEEREEKKEERSSKSGLWREADRCVVFLFLSVSGKGSREFRYNARLARGKRRRRGKKGLMRAEREVKLHGWRLTRQSRVFTLALSTERRYGRTLGQKEEGRAAILLHPFETAQLLPPPPSNSPRHLAEEFPIPARFFAHHTVQPKPVSPKGLHSKPWIVKRWQIWSFVSCAGLRSQTSLSRVLLEDERWKRRG